MKIDTATASRLGVYFFYDADGVVDEYVLHFLREMNKSLTRLIVVCNGLLTAEGKAALENVGASPVVQRDNSGFDVWAYKTAIDLVGWDDLGEFDEIILMNFTVMGPFRSFEPMFAEMDDRDLDFWGITVHHGADFDPWGIMPDGVVPLHIQSHFIAVRRPMVQSAQFQSYWDNMFPVNSYEDSVGRHESLFTQRFERDGFTWGVYVDTDDIVDRGYYPLFNSPVELLHNRRSPIFKRKGFFSLPEHYLDENANRPARQLLEYLAASDGYDEKLIIEHIVRSANNYDMVMALNLIHVLSSRDDHRSESAGLSTAVVVAVRSATELTAKRRYLEAAPAGSAIFIVSSEPVDVDSWKLSSPPVVEVVDTLERSALDYWLPRVGRYDLLCVLEPSEVDGVYPHTNQEAATEHYLDSVLASSAFAERVVAEFEQNPALGSLVPLHPLHHLYFGHYGHEWGDNFDAVESAFFAAGVHVPLSSSRPPVASAAGVFWARSNALQPFANHPEAYAALSEEARRLSVPYVGQSEGFYAAFLAPDVIAANLLITAIHVIRGANQRVGLIEIDDETHPDLVGMSASLVLQQLEEIKDYRDAPNPRKARMAELFFDFGDGISAVGSLRQSWTPGTEGGLSADVSFPVPQGVVGYRFDPVDGAACVCEGLVVKTDIGQAVDATPFNALTRSPFDFFSTDDPQYVLGDVPAGTVSLRFHLDQLILLMDSDASFDALAE